MDIETSKKIYENINKISKVKILPTEEEKKWSKFDTK